MDDGDHIFFFILLLLSIAAIVGAILSITVSNTVDNSEITSAFSSFMSNPMPDQPIDVPDQPNIAMVSVSVGDRPFAQLSRERLQQYCDRHGYDLHYYDQTIDSNYQPIWQKTLAVRNALSMTSDSETGYKYDAVVWIDDDIYITNPDYRLENIIKSARRDIILTADPDSNYRNCVNTGLYIVINTDIGRQFMNDVIDGYHMFGGKYQKNYYHEQTISLYLYYAKYYPYTKLCVEERIQTFERDRNKWQPGDFCLHLCGASNPKRCDIFTKLRNGEAVSF